MKVGEYLMINGYPYSYVYEFRCPECKWVEAVYARKSIGDYSIYYCEECGARMQLINPIVESDDE